MSTTLKICVLALTLALVTAKPLERERRQTLRNWWRGTKTFLQDAGQTVSDGVQDAYAWATGSVDDEAQTLLLTEGEAEKLSQELLERGAKLLAQADKLKDMIVDEVNDPENVERIQNAIDALTQAANDAVETGQTINKNRENITKALGDSFDDLSAVVQDSLANVGGSVLDTGDSIVDAGKALALVGGSAVNASVEIIEAIEEVMETSALVVKAGDAFEEVGQNALSLGQRVMQMGMDLGEVLRQAGRDIYNAAGFGEDAEDQDS
ncbi:hypothetical protein PoB_006102100 [Plakobranchus ocellatus]|uniref:Uncharacterized protein n=1 Tax=Plakobranchus ocellatus TaxID=259542 RepID=A0AAV4CRU4_9GAST|nr:hypothetical protein PoB_006102100 [Plakobranchus ocellatus]